MPIISVRQHDLTGQFRNGRDKIIRLDIADGGQIAVDPSRIFTEVVDERPAGFFKHVVGVFEVEQVMDGKREQHICQPGVREDVRVEKSDHQLKSLSFQL
ncbi:hypothetical protein BSTEL_0136 [Bifidobacterium stellenboschense]|uniref:Uncharacterized protein n=1 Tax=Bifidobacterium stellenboschense TaxID=762211 RepID=A0A087DPG5_9BIFI|nr:hypothetical protein BSTEL_0136 [Bifidobacterium stellenboschense]